MFGSVEWAQNKCHISQGIFCLSQESCTGLNDYMRVNKWLNLTDKQTIAWTIFNVICNNFGVLSVVKAMH